MPGRRRGGRRGGWRLGVAVLARYLAFADDLTLAAYLDRVVGAADITVVATGSRRRRGLPRLSRPLPRGPRGRARRGREPLTRSDHRLERTPHALSTSLDAYEIWFVTGSQSLYGEDTLRQVAEQSQQVAAHLAGLPVRVRLEAGPEGLRQHPPPRARRQCARRGDRRHRLDAHLQPAKMWIAGLDALQKPLLHLTRRRTSSCRGPTSTSTS